MDGVTEGNAQMEQASLTNEEEQPWRKVDLERDCRIESIQIFNCTDKGDGHLKDFRVSVLDKDGTTVWEQVQQSAHYPDITLKVGGVAGRFVKLQLLGKGELALAEVIVNGAEAPPR